MENRTLSTAYRLIAELLLGPAERDQQRIDHALGELGAFPPSIAEPLRAFHASPAAHSQDEYTQTLELSPPCPLYLGAYLFEEPTSCRGAGTSGRNGYMLELTAVYRHFGLELRVGELSDYLPLALEFAALSLELGERDRIGLRRRFLEQQLEPALAPLRQRLEKYESPYSSLIGGLEALVALDLATNVEAAWAPPDAERTARKKLPLVPKRTSPREVIP